MANITGGDLEKLPSPSSAPKLGHLSSEVLIARRKLRLTLPRAETSLLIEQQVSPTKQNSAKCTMSLLSTGGGFTPRMKYDLPVCP